MNWTDLLWGAGVFAAGAIGGLGYSKWIKGKPPANADAWDQAKKEGQAKQK